MLKLGQKIDANEETRNLAELMKECFSNKMSLIFEINHQVIRDRERFSADIQKTQPELAGSGFAYDFEKHIPSWETGKWLMTAELLPLSRRRQINE